MSTNSMVAGITFSLALIFATVFQKLRFRPRTCFTPRCKTIVLYGASSYREYMFTGLYVL